MVGWREWVALPSLGVAHLRAKTDTGAKSCALHAEQIERFVERGVTRVRFVVSPFPEAPEHLVRAEAELIEDRLVRSSDGDVQRRPVVLATLGIAGVTRDVALTLTRRDLMGFRMLVGRDALRGFFVDPTASYLGGGGPGVVEQRSGDGGSHEL